MRGKLSKRLEATIRGRHETLEGFGVAAERFPSFVNVRFEPHELDVVLITVVLGGTGHHVIDGVEHIIPGPSFSITRLGESHVLMTDEIGLDVVNVYLDTDARSLPRIGAPLDVALAALLPWSPTAPRVTLPQVALTDARRMRSVLDLLVGETEHPGPGSGDALDALLRILLVECARAMMEHGFLSETGDRRAHPAIERVRAYLDRTYLEHHSLDELATLAHLERTYLSRLFTETMGQTVTDYLTRLRVGYAMAQLSNTDLRIAQIAVASGFRDLSHFGRTFLRHAGMTPREYRRRSTT